MTASAILASLEAKDQRTLFELVAKLVRETSPANEPTSNHDKLRLYGLYKHVTEGPCSGENTPSIFQTMARYKYQAWLDCQALTVNQAMAEYIHLVLSLGDDLGQKCQSLIEKFGSASKGDCDTQQSRAPSVQPWKAEDNHSKDCLTFQRHVQHASPIDYPSQQLSKQLSPASFLALMYSWISSLFILLCQIIGVRPLIPRGRLDMTYKDLFYGMWQCCLWWRATPYHCQQKSCEIRQVCGHNGATPGFSVRSLLDLYLTTKKFPKGSQILVAPPISVPGMMLVLRYHDLEIVPVDLPDESKSEWLEISAIQGAITSKTVAIMVVHPFGMLCTSGEGMERLRKLADDHAIELWEDCAECFMGLSSDCYCGNPMADVRFFSFGMIKTSTALGGGIAIFKDPVARQNVERLQQGFPRVQSTFQFFQRLLLSLLLNFIADSPWRVGVLVKACSLLLLDFDHVVTTSLRGFRIQQFPNDEKLQRAVQIDLIRQIRKRPSYALLALLHRRISQSSQQVAVSVVDRRIQCVEMTRILSQTTPHILLPYGSKEINTYWTFPIACANRDVASRLLVEKGFDVVSGASQLCCVSKFCPNNTTPCPNATKLMDSILYVPIASQKLNDGDLQEIAQALKDAIKVAESPLDHINVDPPHLPPFSAPVSSIFVLGCTILLAATSRWTVIEFLQGTVYFCTTAISWALMGLLMAILGLYFLCMKVGKLYLEGSTGFANHCDLIDAATFERPPQNNSTSGNSILSKMDELCLKGLPSVNGGHAVILTGATGFVGSMVLRDLLHQRRLISLRRVIIICREKKGEAASSRISNLLRKPMFNFLSEQDKLEFVHVVNGDVSLASAGLSPENLCHIENDSTISHVIHCAAVVGFNQELPDAARSNITSTLNMQALTARLNRKGARFIHISTAFVHGGHCGSSESPLNEDLFQLSPFNAKEIYQSMLGTQYYASKAMAELQFPNSYTLSKCVCEHLLLQQKSVDTMIIRPSIVCPAVEEPFEGWAGDKPTTIVAGACLHLLNQWNIWYLEPNSVPYVPVDVLSRFILKKAFGDSQELGIESDNASSDGSFEKLSQISIECFSESDENSSTDSKQGSPIKDQRIFNATWDASSESTRFSWLEFSVCYLQLGCVLGYFDRILAYATLFVSTQLTPRFCSQNDSFKQVHSLFIRGPIQLLQSCFEALSISTNRINTLLPFLDLPLLFFPFVRRTYYFRSELCAPPTFDSNRYVFSIAVAAHRFISAKNNSRLDGKGPRPKMTQLSSHKIGGKASLPTSTDFWWVISQPRGSWAVRLSAWVFVKIIRRICSSVTIDVVSFRRLSSLLRERKTSEDTYLVLAPTHRSFLDFVLLTFVMFSLPELQLDMPFIIAADDFKNLPFIGWLAQILRAFYIRRGRGQKDPELNEKLTDLKRNCLLESGVSLEVFLEGQRSRDRRFLVPKTGILKSLYESGGNHIVVPITINYERIPEQESMVNEASGWRRRQLNVYPLISWLKNVFAGCVSLGNIHIVASPPSHMHCECREDFTRFAKEIQLRQQDKIILSDYHIRAMACLLDLPNPLITKVLSRHGCKFWPSSSLPQTHLPLPSDKSEHLSIALQAGHVLAPLFAKSHPSWSKWLNHHIDLNSLAPGALPDEDDDTLQVYHAFANLLDAASSAIAEAQRLLLERGFVQPDHGHLLQVASQLDDNNVPALLLQAAIQIHKPPSLQCHVTEDTSEEKSLANGRITVNHGEERLGFWGFADSGFVVKAGKPHPIVTMIGDRYHLSRRSMTRLLPFMESELNVSIDPLCEFPAVASTWMEDIASDLCHDDLVFLEERFPIMSVATHERVRHGTGHSQEDVFAIRAGISMRLPDAIVWPTCQDEVLALVQAAQQRRWCLIPFGGGTNVSNATQCPEKDVEPRPIISVDMKEMNNILWVNEEDGLAHVEAGITGRSLVEELERRGFTVGHEPDSIEFSTLGGWIATKASGMKRSRYGNIEDIVVSVTVMTSQGVLWKGADQGAGTCGRVAEGLDIPSLVLGSEGCLGVICSAIIRIWPLPEVRKFESIIFPCFEAGLNFVRALAKHGSNMPASVRLLDNAHFRLGQALRPDASSTIEKAKELLTKAASTFLLRHLDHDAVVCATISYEGRHREVHVQEATIKELAYQYGGMLLGSKVGKAGYDLTFMIAYLRDFAMTYHVLGESFETFVSWSKIEKVVSATKERIKKEHKERLLPGRPFVGCRVTQLYHEGACLYFYLCVSFDGVKDASRRYSELESAARDEILKEGGSLSHHHGIGKHRASQLSSRMSSAFAETLKKIKHSIDEENIFGVRNGPFSFIDEVTE